MNRRTTAEHHRDAAKAMQRAIAGLRAALRHEDGLEWSGAILEILNSACHVESRLLAYADLAEAGR
jgi:hypothetical protein